MKWNECHCRIEMKLCFLSLLSWNVCNRNSVFAQFVAQKSSHIIRFLIFRLSTPTIQFLHPASASAFFRNCNSFTQPPLSSLRIVSAAWFILDIGKAYTLEKPTILVINPPNQFGDGMIRFEFFGDEYKQDKDKAFEHASSRSSGQENSPAAVNQDKRRTGSLCFLPHSFLGFARFLITSHVLHSWCSLLCQLFSLLPLLPFPGSFPYCIPS